MSKLDWSKYPNFSRHEFDHGGPEMNEQFMGKLQLARKICAQLCKEQGYPEIPFKINSGSRSKEKNQQVGGKPDSTHLYGCACDIVAVGSRARFLIVKSLILAGFTRIFIYNDRKDQGEGVKFIHVDTGEFVPALSKPPHVIDCF